MRHISSSPKPSRLSSEIASSDPVTTVERSVELHSLLLKRPMITAHGSMDRRRVAVACIDDGRHVGRGEASALPGFGLESQDDAESALAKWAETGTIPTSPAAATAVSCAVANLSAANNEVSLCEFLTGRSATGTLACHAIIGDGDVEASSASAVEAVRAGHKAIKLKVAAGPPQRDVERVLAIRDAVGSKVAIRLDANGGWDFEAAVAVLSELAGVGIEFVEEPTRSPAEFRQIAAATGHTIALDEHAKSPELINDISGSGVDVVVAKPAILGGPIRTYATAMQLLDRGLRVVVSSFMDGPVGLDSAVQVAAALPTNETHGVATASMFSNPFPPHLTPVSGALVLR